MSTSTPPSCPSAAILCDQTSEVAKDLRVAASSSALRAGAEARVFIFGHDMIADAAEGEDLRLALKPAIEPDRRRAQARAQGCEIEEAGADAILARSGQGQQDVALAAIQIDRQQTILLV